jgi:hypothetical protein
MGIIYDRIENGIANKGILLGSISGAVDDTTIYFPNGVDFAARYSAVLIDDGVNSETHQLDGDDEREFILSSLFDGPKLLHNYTAANVYLVFPCEFNLGENEINLPGINVWGMVPEEILRSEKSETLRDTFATDETVKSRLTPVTFRYIIMLDCEARQEELIAIMSLACRSMIARQYIWVNGKKLNLFPEGSPTFVEPTEGYNEIPKIQFSTSIEVREDIWQRLSLLKTTVNNRTYNIK